MFSGESFSCCRLSPDSLAAPINLTRINPQPFKKKNILERKCLNVVLIKGGHKHLLRSTSNHGIRGFFSPQDLLHSLTENLQGYDCSQLDASASFCNKKDWIPEVSNQRKKQWLFLYMELFNVCAVQHRCTSKINANEGMNCKISLFLFSFSKLQFLMLHCPFIF